MLTFYFNTQWGTWRLDDVSIREGGIGGAELIENGGFESGTLLGGQWKFCDARYSWITEGTVTALNFNSGRYSYESQFLHVGSDEHLTQAVDIQGNTQYEIEFFLSTNGEKTLTTVTLAVHWGVLSVTSSSPESSFLCIFQ